VVSCGESTVTDAVCHTMQKVKAPNSQKCTECKEAECCVEQTCASGLLAWCSQQDSGSAIDCKTEDPCQVLKKPTGSHYPMSGSVKCVACDLEECCTNKTCVGFTACPSGQIPRQPSDDGGVGCNLCDASECCTIEIKTCTRANFPTNCSAGSKWEESNKCKTATCTADDCCVQETRKCTETYQMTDKCPAGWRHRNASKEDIMCKMCNQAECCMVEEVAAPTTSGKAGTEPDSTGGGNGGMIAAVIIVILIVLGAVGGFFLWRRSRMPKQQYVGLNADPEEYKPPTVTA